MLQTHQVFGVLIAAYCLLLPYDTAGQERAADQTVVAEAALSEAIARGMKLLERSARQYPQHRKCFACHHQTFPLLASNAARLAGIKVDEQLPDEISEFTRSYLQGRIEQIREGRGVPGRGFMTSYAAWTLQLVDEAKRQSEDSARELEQALGQYLLKTQESEGHWKPPSIRPPLEESLITGTVLARRHLKRWRATVTEATQLAPIDAALERSLKWLVDAPLEHHEDRVFRLWGMIEDSANPTEIQKLQAQIISTQKPDGGWSQTATMNSDAYATGQAIYVLKVAGLKPDVPVMQRGVSYLLKTQAPDGSWFVKTRAKPIQEYFDNGDPYEKDQFISITATGWAVAALATAAH